jgi:hypothetical protein
MNIIGLQLAISYTRGNRGRCHCSGSRRHCRSKIGFQRCNLLLDFFQFRYECRWVRKVEGFLRLVSPNKLGNATQHGSLHITYEVSLFTPLPNCCGLATVLFSSCISVREEVGTRHSSAWLRLTQLEQGTCPSQRTLRWRHGKQDRILRLLRLCLRISLTRLVS